MAKYGINRVTLVGNLGKDPELKYLDQGVAVAQFTLATTEAFRMRDGQTEDRTEWHNIVMWRGLAETASKYLRKGSTVYLEGRLINRSWEGPDGQKKYRTEVEADKMVLLDPKPQTISGPPGGKLTPPIHSSPTKDQPGTDPQQDDTVPF